VSAPAHFICLARCRRSFCFCFRAQTSLVPVRFPRNSEGRDAPNGGARAPRSQDDYDRDPYLSSRRKPSHNTTAPPRFQQKDLAARPSVASGSDSTNTANPQSATATNGHITSNKSTIAEEDIEVPYGGLDALERRLGQDPDTDGGAHSDDYYDKMSFGLARGSSTRLVVGTVERVLLSTRMTTRGYGEIPNSEFRIATMQTHIAGLERELEGGNVHARQHEQLDRRVKQLEEELDKFRRVCLPC
jgi:protein SPA2